MFNVTNELKKSFSGDAWHGNHVMQILNNVDPEKAFQHFVPNAHSIAEIALHLTAWTEEITSRLIGNNAVEPERGDWPVPENKSAPGLERIIFDFKVANEELIRQCEEVNANSWSDITEDGMDMPQNKITKAELLNGLIQHHAYHSGQIALLSKF